ncbi:hypothetical protein AB0465_37355 [Streptomyces griseoviridis]|uniref:hypothetical protein n=1 Tax=Streptomyces griseoviridis TaxID=45398 RepID=UPI00344CE035
MVDLIAALNASVAKARTTRGQDADVHQLPRTTDAKKTAKPPAKKTATKKAARKPRSA